MRRGLCVAHDGAFGSDLIAEFTRLAEAGGQTVASKIAGGNTDRQTEDILSLLTAGAKVIAVDAVNIDELEQAMDECDANNVPVLSLMTPINDETATLICPDYREMGRSAAEDAKTLLPGGGSVLMLQGPYDSFVMQMLHDGFKEGLAGTDVKLESPYCDFDGEKAYTAVKKAIASAKKPDLIFSQSESMAKGALKALEEVSAQVQIITIGADAEILQAIRQKKIYAAIYCSPMELAQKAAQYALQLLKDSEAQLPQYAGLTIGRADEANAAELIAQGKEYASLLAS